MSGYVCDGEVNGTSTTLAMMYSTVQGTVQPCNVNMDSLRGGDVQYSTATQTNKH